MAEIHTMPGATQATPPTAGAYAQLAAIAAVAAEVAQAICNARKGLRENAEDPDLVNLAADALDRAGWMAERIMVLAGDEGPGIVGGPDEWLLGSVSLAKIAAAKRGADHA